MDKAQAEDYLHSLLNKTLRITTNDTRMFTGHFRCTDSDRNVILTQAFEYRSVPPPSSTSDAAEPCEPPEPTARYLGQVVVPGPHISKIELEEFASQTRGASFKNTSAKGPAGADQSASASDRVV